jgi:heptosyltransferase-2/heptosyltransferase-3
MKILLIQFYQTGDVVLTTHIPGVIKKHLPDSELHFLTFTANAPVLEGNPHVDRVVTCGRRDGAIAFFKLLMSIKREKYDAVLDFQDNPRSTYVTIASLAKRRITYDETSRKIAYSELAPRLGGHAGRIKLSLAAKLISSSLNPDTENTCPEIFPTDANLAEADRLISEMGFSNDDFLVGVSPTHKNETRRWKLKHFIDVSNYLAKYHKSKIIYTCGPGERKYIAGIRETENIKILPDTNLGVFCAVLSKMKLLIGNDSAPHHIATAAGVPTFIILGSTSPGWVFPSPEHKWVSKGLNCQPCRKSKCSVSEEIPCMENLSFEDIRYELEEFIRNAVFKI